MSNKRLVVVGGNAAGLSAASYVKRRKPEIEVIVFEKSPYASYGSCGLPYYVEGIVRDPMELIAIPLKALREKRGLDVRVMHEVTEIELKRRSVRVANLENGKDFELSFDWLVISTGAIPLVPSFMEKNIPGVFTLRTLEDGIKLERFIEERKPSRVTVVGGGYIGMERF